VNPQEYELWHENFSAMIRLNPRWDSYDRLALELFRKKQRPLKVLEFGFTPRETQWYQERCFTQQMDWMAEQGIAQCHVVEDDEDRLDLCRRNWPRLGRGPIADAPLSCCDLVVGTSIELDAVLERLKPGALVATFCGLKDEKKLMKQFNHGVMDLYRRV
jgi:hypothetical protein